MSYPIAPDQVTLALEGWNASDLESRELFERSIRSMAAQTYPVQDCEVLLLVDAGSAGSQLDWIHSYLPQAKLVPVPGSTYYRIKNAGLEHATREFVVYADSDVAYASVWLESMLKALSQHDGVIAGNTQFDDGFLSRTLNLTEWAASRPESGPTDWFYGNNLAARRSLLETYGFREDLGPSGGGGVDILRQQLRSDGVPIWFCAEAKGWHYVAPFWSKYTRLGAYQIHTLRAAPQMRWAWLARLPLLAPFLVIGGGLLKAWRRAWRLRNTLPLRGLSLPVYLVAIAFVKSVEWMGAAAYAYFPGWVRSRRDWFTLPQSSATRVPNT